MQQRTFERDAQLLTTVTVEKLQQAQREEEAHKPITDPSVRLLRRHIYATSGRVMGSDESRSQLRSQIWSTCIMLNPPTLWITINPCDLHDPIAQVFAGEQIDLDKFQSMLGPSKEKRAEHVAADLYAAAKFFWEEMICRYGVIAQIVTDNGSEVKGAFEKLMQRYSIPQIHCESKCGFGSE